MVNGLMTLLACHSAAPYQPVRQVKGPSPDTNADVHDLIGLHLCKTVKGSRDQIS